MNILFLIYHGFSEVSGISKKIHYQVKGLRESGHDVRLCYYGFAENGHRCRYIDGQVIKDYGKGKWAAIHQRLSYKCVYDYCIREGIQFVYARCFQNANPWLVHLFKRLKKAGIYTVTEIPTYPYDSEFVGFSFQNRMGLKVDQLFRHRLYAQMDALVTFSDATEIFGQRTINISNGVDFDSIPLHDNQLPTANSPLHLIGVAEVHYWHGYDRLIAGLGEYYQQVRSEIEEGKLKPEDVKDVYFHIVGGVHPHTRYKSCTFHLGLQTIIDQYNIQDKVIFHGTLFGDELTAVFNQCQFAIGSLGRHRSGITVIKTLKNREYATRGIPFIYSEQDSDFDHQPYVLKAPADESPIDLQRIIGFISNFTMKPEDIRKSVGHLTWKIQMQRVIDAVFG